MIGLNLLKLDYLLQNGIEGIETRLGRNRKIQLGHVNIEYVSILKIHENGSNTACSQMTFKMRISGAICLLHTHIYMKTFISVVATVENMKPTDG